MSNNINLGNGRAVMAAIAHTPNNGYRFKNVGMIPALRSPSLSRLIQATNPFAASQEEGKPRITVYKEDTYNPRIKLSHKPQSSQGYRTSRTAAGGSTGSNGVAGIQATISPEIVYNKTIEFEIEEDLFHSNVFKESSAIAYVNAFVNPKLRLAALNNPAFARIRDGFGNVGLEIISRLDADMMKPAENDAITTMVAGIGKNAAFPDPGQVGDGTTDAPIPEVAAFNADGTPCVDLYNAIMATARSNGFTGAPIVVGGNWLANYMQLKGVVGAADTGFLLDKLVELPIEWYFSSRIDTAFGQNKIIMFDSGAACFQTWLDHSDYGLQPVGPHAGMYFGNMSVDIAQYKGQDLMSSSSGNTLSLDLDFRSKEGLDSYDLRSDRIIPMLRYGIYKRPVGFFTSDTSDIMNKVTGIFGFELVTKS